MKPYVIRVLFWLLMLAAICEFKKAYGYEILEPTTVILEGEKYDALRDPYIPEQHWVYGAALTTKFTLFGDRAEGWRTFYDPTFSLRGTESQVREGSLRYEWGAEILKERGLRVFRRHESRHRMEIAAPDRSYPVLDSWVIQISWELK
jgi:hypothetical protein